eukprot:m.166260 g.166260  ORF g.166260 m.166260 type:complete len:157 (+) comp12665_c0_seq1:80-550(+)
MAAWAAGGAMEKPVRQPLGTLTPNRSRSLPSNPPSCAPSSVDQQSSHAHRNGQEAESETTAKDDDSDGGYSSTDEVPFSKILRVGTRVRAAVHLHDWLDEWQARDTLTLRPLESHYSAICRVKRSRTSSEPSSAHPHIRLSKHSSEGNRFITDMML